MKLIVGLGNPGKEYENTRHNIGFMFIDYYVQLKKCDSFKKKFKGEYTTFTQNDEKVILCKPLTYMNLSGEAIIELLHFFKIQLNDLVVIYDDKDIEFATLRLREKGNPGSHNGMKNITLHLNSNEFKRIRVGIGQPKNGMNMIDFVLSKFNENECLKLNQTFEKVGKACDDFINNKFNIAMNKYNIKEIS